MKTDKNGKIKLAKNEVRAGNYVVAYHEKTGEISVQDINGMIFWRVSSLLGKGAALKMMFDGVKDGKEIMVEALRNFCFVDHYALGAVIPAGKMPEYVAFLTECIKSNKALYGLKDEISEEEDAKALESAKGLNALDEELSKIED